METPPTRTYLNDHRVGAGVALGIIDRLLVIGRRGRRHDELVKLLEWLKAQLVSDRATLEEVAGLIDAPIDPLHRAFGRIAGGMAALKLTAPMSGSETGARAPRPGGAGHRNPGQSRALAEPPGARQRPPGAGRSGRAHPAGGHAVLQRSRPLAWRHRGWCWPAEPLARHPPALSAGS